MTKKTVGYVHLEWTCPACGTRNQGTDKICVSCGAPQPDDVQFEQPAQEEFISDEAVIEQAQQGPDVHCPYCGTRNPAGATTCSQCLADLTDAEKRESGRVVGAHHDEPVPDVKCASCGAMNPATARRCSQCGATLSKPGAKAAPSPQPAAKSGLPGWAIAVGAIVLLFLCGGLLFMLLKTDDVTGTVADSSWEYTVVIEGLAPAEHKDWQDQIPAEAEIISCEDEVRSVQDSPAPNSEEVCGTPYTVDTGTGVGEVVQDCEYRVYDAMCRYTVMEWQAVDTAVASGHNLQPDWPQLNLANDQREGAREADFVVVFRADGRDYTYHPDTLEEYLRFQPGSAWLLKVNQLDAVVGVEPKG